MNNKQISNRCDKFLADTGATISAFCRNVKISTACFYKMRNDSLVVSEKTLRRISQYLERFGY